MSVGEQIGYLLSNYYTWFLEGLLSTTVLSVVGTIGGLFLGIFLALGSSIRVHRHDRVWTKVWKYFLIWLCRIYSTVIRGTPMMVQAMIFKFGCQMAGLNWNNVLPTAEVFNGWFWAGIVVITFNTAAYMGEVVKSGLNGVDIGQEEGARSLGLSRMQTMFLVQLPQALKNSIPTIGNEWIVNIKDSSVLNVISVTELFYRSGQAASRTYMQMASYLIIAAIYLILTLCTNGILALAKVKMDGKKIHFGFVHAKA